MKKLFKSLWPLMLAVAIVACDPTEKVNPGPDDSDDQPTPAVQAKEGVYFLMGGNYMNDNGAFIWLKPGFTAIPTLVDTYNAVNTGRYVGSLLEDMFISGDSIFLLTQNGTAFGGDGQLVILDGNTFAVRKVYADLGSNN